MDFAAAHALQDINWKSIQDDLEYGGWIYSNPNGSYTYTSPVKGKQHSIPAMTMINGLDPNRKDQPVAFYHTHGKKSKGYQDESFSGRPLHKKAGDIDFAIRYTNDAVAYLATPKGVLKKYDAGVYGGKQTNLHYAKKNEGKVKCDCK